MERFYWEMWGCTVYSPEQSYASSFFCGSLHGNENVNYLAQVSPYYVAG